MRSTRTTVLLALVVALVILCGCSVDASGRVVSKSSGTPIAGAIVMVSDTSTTTASDGSFLLSGLKKKQTKGVVRIDGYADTQFELKSGATTVEVPDSVFTLLATENAVEPKPVKEFKLKIDSEETTVASPTFGPLPPGAHTIEVTADGCEAMVSTVTLVPGSNEVSATMSLTALETYRRFFNAGQYHRDAVAYKYIHPAERKRLSLKKWKAWGAGTEDKSVKFGDTRMLSKWTSKYMKKTYSNVAEIDRTTVWEVSDPKYSDYGKSYTDNHNQHWVKVDGKWFVVHAEGP